MSRPAALPAPQLVQRHFRDLATHDHINIDLRLRQTQPAVEKLDRGLKTMRRVLCFRAHYLEQIGYGLARMAGRFKPSRALLLGQFS